MKKILIILAVVIFVGAVGYGLTRMSQKTATTPTSKNNNSKIQVVTTLFPLYDFAKRIGQDQVEVTLLLPPGMEAHSFEPRPGDIAKINSSDVFVYTGEFMEPWAIELVSGLKQNRPLVVDASRNISLLSDSQKHSVEDGDEHRQEAGHVTNQHHSQRGSLDPHVWLDLENAQLMTKNIAEALIQVSPENKVFFEKNVESYISQLQKLDADYQVRLSNCASRKIIFGGHYAFGYLAKRYDLEYVAAQGFSPDTEPTANELISLVEQVRAEKIPFIFYEELASPKIAQTISRETDAQLISLSSAHNVSREELLAGIDFLGLMKENLNQLITGLRCTN